MTLNKNQLSYKETIIKKINQILNLYNYIIDIDKDIILKKTTCSSVA